MQALQRRSGPIGWRTPVGFAHPASDSDICAGTDVQAWLLAQKERDINSEKSPPVHKTMNEKMKTGLAYREKCKKHRVFFDNAVGVFVNRMMHAWWTYGACIER